MGLGVLTNGRTQEHRYQTCRDESCERFACRVWREGYGAGHGAGKAEGHAEGYDEASSMAWRHAPARTGAGERP